MSPPGGRRRSTVAALAGDVPVVTETLSGQSRFRFDCHPGLTCFNACCRRADVPLTPWDIVRLRRHFGLDSATFVARYTIPYEMDADALPGLRLANNAGACVFLGKEGCQVYAERPLTCRYYALGKMTLRPAGAASPDERYFVVREPHCLGHTEPLEQSVDDYRRRQGIPEYDRANRDWIEIVVKKRSAGPAIGEPSPRSRQLFDMCSYDIDGFRRFLLESGIRDIFDLPDAAWDRVLATDDALLAFAMRYLRQVLFGERSIPLRPGAARVRHSGIDDDEEAIE